MFGIKTKKDRKIEELNEKIEKLEERIYFTSFKQPRIYQLDKKTETVTAMRIIENDIPLGVIKREIAMMLTDELFDQIVWTVAEVNDKKAVRGSLDYVVGGTRSWEQTHENEMV